jgi:DNA polymerase-3 subunit epsilon
MEVNLADVLRLTRPLIVYDVESTGKNPDTDRIIEIGFQAWYHDGRPVKEYRTLINPLVPIPEASQRVHKIDDESIRNCSQCGLPGHTHPSTITPSSDQHLFKPWPTFKQLAPHLLKGFVDCDFAGKNVRYDLRITAAEFARAGFQWSYVGARIIDADRLEQLGEPRTLSHLYEKHTGKKIEDAHQALADVRATTELIIAQMNTYRMLPRDLNLLHNAQWPEAWLDGRGSFKMIDGVATCTFGKHRGKSMREVPLDYYDWILKPSTEMPADIKQLAADAKLGKFPDDKREQ